MAAVNSGLSEGERVVVDGTDRLRDGARVIVPGSSGQKAQSGAAGNPTAPNAPPAGATGNTTPGPQPQTPPPAHGRRSGGSQ
jgi:multidrug efflux system membrane fusion protein